MPFGEPVMAVLEKMNVGSGSAFCNYVRSEYRERCESQRAASAKRHAELAEERAAEQEREEESVSVLETDVCIRYWEY
jgi:hypothetical protein